MRRLLTAGVLVLLLTPLQGAPRDDRAIALRALEEIGANLEELERSRRVYEQAAAQLAAQPAPEANVRRAPVNDPRRVMQNESRRMDALLRTTKARHDVAMNAIRNIKA
jgi:hypothetical protein